MANRTLDRPLVTRTTAAETVAEPEEGITYNPSIPRINLLPRLPFAKHHDIYDQMAGPTVTRGRTFSPHQSALHVDETPVGRAEQSPQPGFSRFSPRRIPFVSQLMRGWGKGRDKRSQSRPPPPPEQPPIPSALAPAIEADSSPLPTLSMVVLSIVCFSYFLRTC